MAIFGFWMFLTAVVLAPWISSWLKERERQKTIRTFVGEHGKVDQDLLEYFHQNELEELSRKKPFFRFSSSEQCIGWLVIILSFMGGLAVLLVGEGAAGRSGSTNVGLLVGSIVASFIIWALGLYVGIKIHQSGSKNGSPPAE